MYVQLNIIVIKLKFLANQKEKFAEESLDLKQFFFRKKCRLSMVIPFFFGLEAQAICEINETKRERELRVRKAEKRILSLKKKVA